MFREDQTVLCESDLNSLYTRLFSSLPAPVIIFDAGSGAITDVNDEALKFYGYSRNEMLKLTMPDISIETDDASISFRLPSDEDCSAIPVRYHRKKNGEILPVEILPTRVDSNGRQLLCGIVKDVSKRTQTEMSLRKSDQRYATLLANLPGIAFQGRNDSPRSMMFISEQSYDILGYNPETLTDPKLPVTYADLIHPDDRERVYRQLNDAVNGLCHYSIVYRISTADGSQKFMWEQGRVSSGKSENDIILEGFISNITELKRIEFELKKENMKLRTSVSRSNSFGDIIGKSKVMGNIYDQLLKASMTDANVIIYGESGTGKEMAAKAIHDLSDRKEKPFIIVNCGAIPHDLLESEFFGYKRGAFTGAAFDKAGYLESAEGGTLFLDEIGEISKNMQVKLLRAIDGGGYTPLGSRDNKYPDIRIISATNKDMKSLVHSGDIREDFFYRIHVLAIMMPPLRHRKGDINLLTHHFVKLYSNYTVFTIQPSLLKAFENYQWPGNVRELKNVIMRYIALKTDPSDDVYQLDFLLEASSSISCGTPESSVTGSPVLKEAIEAFEKKHIREILDMHRWHQGKTAEKLGIHAKTLARKMKRYGLV